MVFQTGYRYLLDDFKGLVYGHVGPSIITSKDVDIESGCWLVCGDKLSSTLDPRPQKANLISMLNEKKGSRKRMGGD